MTDQDAGRQTAGAYGPQEATEADVRAAREKAWDAFGAAGPESPETTRAADDYTATIHRRHATERHEDLMTSPSGDVPWSEPTPGEAAEYARREAAASDRYHHVPARDEAGRAECDGQEWDEAAAEADRARYVHFNGAHVQDPPEHGEHCADSCPYDTPEKAAEREAARLWAEQQEAAYTAEMEAGQ